MIGAAVDEKEDLGRRRIIARVPARAGLAGGPSGVGNGRVVAVAVDNYAAEVELTPSDGVSITPSAADRQSWESLSDLQWDSDRYGFIGGTALIQAALAAYADFLQGANLEPQSNGFRLAYRTTIPRQVGLGGSSAIVLAALRAVIEHHGVGIEPALVPSLALAAADRLGIVAGLQDRVVQAFGGVVAMDFRQRRMRTQLGLEYGEYRFLDPAGLSPLYLAWSKAAAANSASVHAELRARLAARDWAVVSGIKMLSSLAEQAEEAVRLGDHEILGSLLDQSFDIRRRMIELPAGQVEMAERARSTGASATLAGSGSAIVGTYRGIEQINELAARLEPLGATVTRLDVAAEFSGL